MKNGALDAASPWYPEHLSSLLFLIIPYWSGKICGAGSVGLHPPVQAFPHDPAWNEPLQRAGGAVKGWKSKQVEPMQCFPGMERQDIPEFHLLPLQTGQEPAVSGQGDLGVPSRES